jgi:hypothetical protein
MFTSSNGQTYGYAYSTNYCTWSTWSDQYGWHHNNVYDWTTSSGELLMYTELDIQSGIIHFQNYFKWWNTGQYQVTSFNTWWKIEFYINQAASNHVIKHWDQHIYTEQQGSVQNWAFEEFYNVNNAGQLMKTYNYADNVAAGNHRWAAFNVPPASYYNHDTAAARGANLGTMVMGSEFIKVNTPTDNTMYYSWTEWMPLWA